MIKRTIFGNTIKNKKGEKNTSNLCQCPISQDEIKDSRGKNKTITANNPSQAISRKYLFLKVCSISSHFRKTKKRPWGADRQAPKRNAACLQQRCGRPWPDSDFHLKNVNLQWQMELRYRATISMQPDKAPIFISPRACWAPNFLV